MGEAGGRAALDEMGRAVERMLSATGDPPPAARTAVADGWRELPDFVGIETMLAAAEAGWVEWRRRLVSVLPSTPREAASGA